MATTLVPAVEANFVAAWSGVAAWASGARGDDEGTRWISAGRHPVLNAVVETALDPLPAPEAIHRIATELEGVAGSCVWWIQPSAEGADLDERLAAAGFEPWGDPWPGMAVALDDLVPAHAVDGLTLERVADAAALEAFVAVFAATLAPGPDFDDALRRAALAVGFGPDAPMAHYVAREEGDEGEAVACASLIVGGGAAGLYNVGTIERLRGRGIGAWVSSAAMEEGRRRGLDIGALQSSKLGYRVYERLGFREVCRFTPWIRRSRLATSAGV